MNQVESLVLHEAAKSPLGEIPIMFIRSEMLRLDRVTIAREYRNRGKDEIRRILDDAIRIRNMLEAIPERHYRDGFRRLAECATFSQPLAARRVHVVAVCVIATVAKLGDEIGR